MGHRKAHLREIHKIPFFEQHGLKSPLAVWTFLTAKVRKQLVSNNWKDLFERGNWTGRAYHGGSGEVDVELHNDGEFLD